MRKGKKISGPESRKRPPDPSAPSKVSTPASDRGSAVSSKTPMAQSGAVARSEVRDSTGAAEPPAPTGGRSSAPEMSAGKSGASCPFPVVGIGTSAGGLAALEAFFENVPAADSTGMAFVIVQHLDPDHKSILSELVQRYTRMRVMEIADGMAVERNCTYIIPPNRDLALSAGKLRLSEPEMRRGLRMPIDYFFKTLALEQGEYAIGVILSGSGTDGTLGLRAIKEAGGLAVVQEPGSAEYEGMPRSALLAGLADYVLRPEQIVGQLLAYCGRVPVPGSAEGAPGLVPSASEWIVKIVALLNTHTGHDFANYKQNTIRRRIERRMAVNQVDTLAGYLEMLHQSPTELEVLFRELLIGVTGFFRDPPAFDALRDLVLAPLLKERAENVPLRVWVPGCSTGEEAYSIAMLVNEIADEISQFGAVQVFATDIDPVSIAKARSGVYPANIAAEVSPERLARFFTHEEKDFYRVKKGLRDCLVFAEQDVIRDPPFSKLDLISCRNLLIYMDGILQKLLIPLFHYALAPGGFLFLGNSESVGEFTNLFVSLERKWKLYRRRDIVWTPSRELTVPRSPMNLEPVALSCSDDPEIGRPNLRELTERTLLRKFAPACVIVNSQGEIVYVHGRTGKYLELPPGEASLNLIRAAREGLKAELTNALHRVVTQRQPVHFERLEARPEGGFQGMEVNMELIDSSEGGSNYILVTFQESEPRRTTDQAAARKGEARESSPSLRDEKDRYIGSLERELRAKSESLQSTIEEMETSNEELKSTNEELQSANEELQSTNEELETSKEELQSVNEELVTVNSELQQKMESLSRANSDIKNLLAGTGIGMLFVDHRFHIQRFTPATTQIIKLIQTDVGRPVGDLVSNLMNYDRLEEDIKAVLDNLIPREAEVQSREGGWFQMRIQPYRTLDNVIEGVVLTFVNIDAQKRAEDQLRKLGSQLEQRVQERVAEGERLGQEVERLTRQLREGDSEPNS